MIAIKKMPGQMAELAEIDNTLEALQAAVGGYIETVTFAEDCVVICNEEGRLRAMSPNCTFLGIDFVGPLLVVGVDGEKFCSVDTNAVSLLLKELDK